MSRVVVGVVDYGLGNHASLIHCLRDLGFRVHLSADTTELNRTDILILPGVGTFPAAMQGLQRLNLIGYIQKQAGRHHPVVGICLGMQLLTSFSHEIELTAGLDLIPGVVVAIPKGKWHIGWNTLVCTNGDPLFQLSDGLDFYFNHSYCYFGPENYQVCVTHFPTPFSSVIRRGNVVGIQFHPEKSQDAGKELLRSVIMGLVDA